MKKSAFLPGQKSDLVCRHMQSHHRRVVQAKGRVDTSTPKAILSSIRVKDRAARERSSSALKSVVESSRGGEPRDQRERRHREAQTAPPVPVDPGYVCGTSGRSRVRYPHLLELSPEQEDSGRWHLYHTPTGRLTGYLRERQKYSLAAQEESNKRSPWLPPSTSPGPRVTAGNNKVSVRHKDNHSAKASAHKYRDSIMVAAPESDSTDQPAHATVRQFVGDRESVQEMDATYTVPQSIQPTLQRTTHSTATTGDAVSKPRWHHEESPLAPETSVRSERYSRGKEMVVEGAEMRHEALAIARRNDEAIKKYQDQAQEYRYLQFVSEVTRDILSRRVLTGPALNLLCRTHMDTHRHQLREDEMEKRLELLKKQIGVTL